MWLHVDQHICVGEPGLDFLLDLVAQGVGFSCRVAGVDHQVEVDVPLGTRAAGADPMKADETVPVLLDYS
jgi:hypothetical protein